MPLVPTRRLLPGLAAVSVALLAASATGADAASRQASSVLTGSAQQAASRVAAQPVRDDGPHSPLGRVPAPTSVTTTNGVSVSRYDLGDVEVGAKAGQFRAPVRGSLITPTTANGPTKLVIVSHLRTGGCAGHTYAFPCPGGDIRLDRGMEYFGEALAKQGYTVLIPDVAPVWIGTNPTTPYNQSAAWLKVVGAARDALATDVAGTTSHFHLSLTGRVDMSGAGLFVHSRSGLIVSDVEKAWKNGPTPIRSVLAYGPAYDVPDVNNHVTGPVAPDVPYLALVGDADQDVPFNAQLWLAENIEQKRTAMAAVATVPGLGHNYINRALSSTRDDDRLNCDASCPSAAVHEAFLTSSATSYFAATLKSQANSAVPLTSSSPLPATIGGLSARWLAVTDAINRVVVLDADHSTKPTATRGSSVTTCRFYDPQDPTPYADKCSDPDRGVVELVSRTLRLRLAAGGSVSVPAHLVGATSLNLQLAPYGDRADGRSTTPVSVSVTTASGHRVNVPLSAAAQAALANRRTSASDGTYVLSTVRLALPASLAGETITTVTLTAPQGADLALRAIDATATSGSTVNTPSTAGAGASGGATGGASSGGTSSGGTSSGGTVLGPKVQTDFVPAG